MLNKKEFQKFVKTSIPVKAYTGSVYIVVPSKNKKVIGIIAHENHVTQKGIHFVLQNKHGIKRAFKLNSNLFFDFKYDEMTSDGICKKNNVEYHFSSIN